MSLKYTLYWPALPFIAIISGQIHQSVFGKDISELAAHQMSKNTCKCLKYLKISVNPSNPFNPRSHSK